MNDTNPGTELPIVTTPVTISIAKERHMLDTTTSYNEKASFKNITEETGLTLEFIELAAGTAGEQVPQAAICPTCSGRCSLTARFCRTRPSL